MEWNTVMTEVRGEEDVKELLLKDVKTGETRSLEADGVFIYVGITPITDFVSDLAQLDPGSYIVTDQTMQSSVPGLYAAGDVRSGSIRQVSTAVGDGATAAYYAYKYLEEKN